MGLASCAKEDFGRVTLQRFKMGSPPADLASTPIARDGSYRFSAAQSRQAGMGEGEGTFVLVADLCDGSAHARIMTKSDAQDISAASTMIMQATLLGGKTDAMNRAEFDKLVRSLPESEGFAAVLRRVASDGELARTIQDKLGVGPDTFAELPPLVRSITAPASVVLGETAQLSVRLIPLNPNYPVAQDWQFNAKRLSQEYTFTWTPKRDAVGLYDMTLYVGRRSGDKPDVDVSHPYLIFAIPVEVRLSAQGPREPRELEAHAVSQSEISLSWRQPDPPNADFVVASRAGDLPPLDCTGGVVTANLKANLKGMAPGENYSFRVCGRTLSEEVSGGAVVTARTLDNAPTQAPTIASVTEGDASTVLTWAALDVAGAHEVQYDLYFGTSPGVTTASQKVADVRSPFLHAGLVNGTRYYYALAARTSGGSGPLSAERNAKPDYPAPPDPHTLTADATSDSSLSLAWQSGGGSTVAYRYAYQAGVTAPADCGAGTTTTATSATLPGLAGNTVYAVRVCARNASTPVLESPGITATARTPPVAPTIATVQVADQSVTLSWAAVPGATGYAVYWKTSAGVSKSDARIAVSSLTETHSALVNGTTYHYAVAAVGMGGESPLSPEVSATPVPLPATPSGIATKAENSRIVIDAPAVPHAASYDIYWKTSPGVTSADNRITGVMLPYTHAALTPGTTYHYKIAAVNAAGSSALSSEASRKAIPYVALPQGLYGYDKLPSSSVYGLRVIDGTIHLSTSGGYASSTDGGATFKVVTTSDGLFRNDAGYFDVSGDNVYVGDNVSHDGGKTFARVGPFGGGLTTIRADGPNVYISYWGNPSLAVSHDEGRTFSPRGPAEGWTTNNISGDIYAKGNLVYVASSGAGLFVSVDAGDNFSLFATTGSGLPSNDVSSVWPDGGTLYVGTGSGLAISSDGGNSWTTRTTAHGLREDNIIKVRSDGAHVYVITGSSFAHSHDGGNTFAWTSLWSPQDIVVEGGVVYVATGGGVYRSTDHGATLSSWITTEDAFSSQVTDVTAADGKIYVTSLAGGVIVSGDGGKSFKGLPGIKREYVTGIAVDGPQIYASSYNGFYMSPDGGATWSVKGSGEGLADSWANCVAKVGGILYVGTRSGLSISADGGQTFVNKTTANGLPHNQVKKIRAQGGVLYFATPQGLAISSDGGASFTNATTAQGLSHDTVNDVTSVGGKIIVATNAGLSISSDGGTSFTADPATSGDYMTAVSAQGSTVYAGGLWGGLYVSHDGGSTFTMDTDRSLASATVYSLFTEAPYVLIGTGGGLSTR